MDTIAQISEQLGSADQTAAFKARRALTVRAFTAGTPGKEAERTALAAELAGCLVAKADNGGDKKKEPTPRYSVAAQRSLPGIGGRGQ